MKTPVVEMDSDRLCLSCLLNKSEAAGGMEQLRSEWDGECVFGNRFARGSIRRTRSVNFRRNQSEEGILTTVLCYPQPCQDCW